MGKVRWVHAEQGADRQCDQDKQDRRPRRARDSRSTGLRSAARRERPLRWAFRRRRPRAPRLRAYPSWPRQWGRRVPQARRRATAERKQPRQAKRKKQEDGQGQGKGLRSAVILLSEFRGRWPIAASAAARYRAGWGKEPGRGCPARGPPVGERQPRLAPQSPVHSSGRRCCPAQRVPPSSARYAAGAPSTGAALPRGQEHRGGTGARPGHGQRGTVRRHSSDYRGFRTGQ